MSTQSDDDGPRGYDWEDALATLNRRRGLIAKVLAVGIIATFALIFAAGPSYRAVATLLVDPTHADVPVTPSAGTGPVIDRDRTDLRLMSSVALLQSPLLLREVLSADPSLYQDEEEEVAADGSGASGAQPEDLHPILEVITRLAGMFVHVSHLPGALYAALHEVPPTTELDEAVAAIRERLEVRRIAGSSLIEVSYADESPQRAARLVNSLLDYFVSEAARLPEQEDDAMRFFNEQYGLLSDRLDAAKVALREFHQREGARLLLESEAEQRAILADLRQTEVDARSAMAEVDGHLAQLMAEVATLPPNRTRDLRLHHSEAVQSLKQRIVELQLQRDELLSRYTSDSIHVRDIERQLDRALQMLAEEEASSVSSEAVLDPTLQALELDLVQARTRKTALQAKLVSLASQIAGYEERLDRRDALAVERSRLEHELGLAQDVYRVYRRKEEEARFELALRHSQILSVAVVERAIPASMPQSGRKRVKLMLGAFFSLMGGIGLAFLLDFKRENDFDGGEHGGLDEFDDFAAFPELDHAVAGSAATARPSMFAKTARHVAGAILAVSALTALAVVLLALLGRRSEGPVSVAAVTPVIEPDVASIASLVVKHPRGAADAGGVERSMQEPAVAVRPAPVIAAAAVSASQPRVSGPRPGVVQEASRAVSAPVATAVPWVSGVAAEAKPPPAVAVAASATLPAPAAPVPATRVTVERGATFYSLVRSVYGAYDEDLVELVVRANPEVTDVRHLEVGHVLIFPARTR